MTLSVTVRDAFKSYGFGNRRHVVLKGLNMTVKSSSIYALIGASGCGKTTLLSAIIGMSPLDSGNITVLGESLSNNRMPSSCLNIGFMPQELSLHNEFNVDETLNFFGNLYQMKDSMIDQRIKLLKTILELPPGERLVRSCSGGEARRISLAIAMIHDPSLLILDEPTVGVDPLLREKIWDFITDLTRKSHVAVIITTHYIEEAQKVDRCGLMRNGILLAEDSPQVICSQTQSIDLSEAFLKLCADQGRVAELENELSETNKIAQAVELKTLKRDKQNDSELVQNRLQRRKVFHSKTIKALIFKSYIQVFRTPMCILMMFIALGQTILFYATMGRNPVGMKIGIVSDELANFTDCDSSTLITTLLVDDDFCTLNKISCRFIGGISDEIGVKRFYENYEQAQSDIKSGKLIAFIHFDSNFSLSTQQFLDGLVGEEDETIEHILDTREIKVYIDRTDFHSSNFIEKKLFDVYQDYIKAIGNDCNLSDTKYDLNFMSFEKPIYGKSEIDIKSQMGPMAILMFFCFGMLANTITNFIDDRKNGSWNRTFLSGISIYEYLFCHAFVHLAIAIFQLIMTISLLFYLYPETRETDHSALIISIFAISGVCGLSLGILLASIFNKLEHCANFANFICDSLLKISGFFWPLIAMPQFLQIISKYFMPTTYAMESLNNIIYKGYGISHPSIWKGMTVLSFWSLVLIILSCLILERRKFSKTF